jgi:hypothetical protein
VLRSDDKFNSIMAGAAEKLHLAGHSVLGKTLLHSAGDTEGHVGQDGRYYVLDMARVFPCEAQSEAAHLRQDPHSVFYSLMRPELLQWLKQQGHPPLSSDALSNWAPGDEEMNGRAKAATKLLVERVIPGFVAKLKSCKLEEVKGFKMNSLFHQAGINMR